MEIGSIIKKELHHQNVCVKIVTESKMTLKGDFETVKSQLESLVKAKLITTRTKATLDIGKKYHLLITPDKKDEPLLVNSKKNAFIYYKSDDTVVTLYTNVPVGTKVWVALYNPVKGYFNDSTIFFGLFDSSRQAKQVLFEYLVDLLSSRTEEDEVDDWVYQIINACEISGYDLGIDIDDIDDVYDCAKALAKFPTTEEFYDAVFEEHDAMICRLCSWS